MKKSLQNAIATILRLGDTEYKELLPFYDRPLRQAPTGVMVIGRLQYLRSKTGGNKSCEDAYNVIVNELTRHLVNWIEYLPCNT